MLRHPIALLLPITRSVKRYCDCKVCPSVCVFHSLSLKKPEIMSGCFRNEKRLHLEPNLEALRRMDVPYGAMEAREARFIVRQSISL